jgi:hypothetical protein
MPKKKQPNTVDLKDALMQVLERRKVAIFVTADDDEMLLIHGASKLAAAISDFKQWLRTETKHSDPDSKYKTPSATMDAVRTAFYVALNEAGVPEDLT